MRDKGRATLCGVWTGTGAVGPSSRAPAVPRARVRSPERCSLPAEDGHRRRGNLPTPSPSGGRLSAQPRTRIDKEALVLRDPAAWAESQTIELRAIATQGRWESHRSWVVLAGRNEFRSERVKCSLISSVRGGRRDAAQPTDLFERQLSPNSRHQYFAQFVVKPFNRRERLGQFQPVRRIVPGGFGLGAGFLATAVADGRPRVAFRPGSGTPDKARPRGYRAAALPPTADRTPPARHPRRPHSASESRAATNRRGIRSVPQAARCAMACDEL